MTKIGLIIFLLGLGFAGTGCTVGEISDGSNGVGIGIGMGPNPGPGTPRYPYDPPYNDPPHNDPYPDYPSDPWPNDPDPISPPDNPTYPSEPNPTPPPRKEPRRPPGSQCDRLGCWDPKDPNMIELMGPSRNSIAANRLVNKYGIPKSSALRIASSFAQVRGQGLDAFSSIGLTQSDFKAMMNRRLPSDRAVKAAALKLGLSEKQSRALLTSMMRSFWAQAANVKSPYWKYCQMGGHWKTDRNRSCSKLNWPGCSPATGAKLCY